jgi:hypothetical protein
MKHIDTKKNLSDLRAISYVVPVVFIFWAYLPNVNAIDDKTLDHKIGLFLLHL